MAEVICKEDNEFDFSDIGKGIVFKYEDDFYIKTAVVSSHEFNSVVCNCVSLKTGYHRCIDPDAKVEIFNKITFPRTRLASL